MSEKLKNKLPTHSPPELVWAAIEQKLNELPRHELKKNRIKQIFPHRGLGGYWGAAASVVVFGFYWWTTRPNEQLTYSQETAVVQPIRNENPVAERQYAQIEASCLQKTAICEKPTFKALKRELDDLTSASNQLKETLGAFNTDRHLVAQLNHIETERSQILQKLVEQL